MSDAVFNTELTPLSYLRRSAEVFGDKTAVVYGELRYGYREFADHVQRTARALRASGVQPGDRVAYLLPNVPEMLVAHFAVPLAGAVLVAINTRLSTEEVRYILDHSGAKLLVVDSVLHRTVAPVAAELKTVTEIVPVA
ncbi:MAG: AMP-binding protein, partial [Pseudonocardia sp.]|nr:AMP-binding protein [Pseudonocardia sp.]